MTSEVHHRHPTHEITTTTAEVSISSGEHHHEASPLLFAKHMSMDEGKESFYENLHDSHKNTIRTTFRLFGAFLAIVVVLTAVFLAFSVTKETSSGSTTHPTTTTSSSSVKTYPPVIVPIEAAHEHWVQLDDGGPMKIWYRT